MSGLDENSQEEEYLDAKNIHAHSSLEEDLKAKLNQHNFASTATDQFPDVKNLQFPALQSHEQSTEEMKEQTTTQSMKKSIRLENQPPGPWRNKKLSLSKKKLKGSNMVTMP